MLVCLSIRMIIPGHRLLSFLLYSIELMTRGPLRPMIRLLCFQSVATLTYSLSQCTATPICDVRSSSRMYSTMLIAFNHAQHHRK